MVSDAVHFLLTPLPNITLDVFELHVLPRAALRSMTPQGDERKRGEAHALHRRVGESACVITLEVDTIFVVPFLLEVEERVLQFADSCLEYIEIFLH